MSHSFIQEECMYLFLLNFILSQYLRGTMPVTLHLEVKKQLGALVPRWEMFSMCCSSMCEWWYEPSWGVNSGPNLIWLIAKKSVISETLNKSWFQQLLLSFCWSRSQHPLNFLSQRVSVLTSLKISSLEKPRSQHLLFVESRRFTVNILYGISVLSYILYLIKPWNHAWITETRRFKVSVSSLRLQDS